MESKNKSIKMLSGMAWVQTPSVLIKSGEKRKHFLRQATLIKVHSVFADADVFADANTKYG
jgi:hypothetical protein